LAGHGQASIISEDEAELYFEASRPEDNYIDGGNMVMRGLHDGMTFELTAIGANGQYVLVEDAAEMSHQ